MSDLTGWGGGGGFYTPPPPPWESSCWGVRGLDMSELGVEHVRSSSLEPDLGIEHVRF
jgi:hypothetical protein